MVKRIGYYDIARGIAIIFVVLGHYGPWLESQVGGFPAIVSNLAYSLHVPLFFIVSGFFFRPDKPYNLKAEAKTLLLPYALTCLFIIGLATIRAFLFDAPGEWVQVAGSWVCASLYGAGSDNLPWLVDVRPIGGLWFLLAMFWGRLFVSSAEKLPCPWVWIVLLFAAGYSSRELVWLPFSLQAGFCAAFYVYIGALAKKYGLFERGRIPIGAWIGIASVWLMVVFWGGRPGLVCNWYPDGLLDIVGAFAGSFAVIAVSRVLEERVPKKGGVGVFLEFIGRNTLAIYCLHIVELNVFPSDYVQGLIVQATGWPMWAACLPLHFALIAIMCIVVYYLPKSISKVFYPKKAQSCKGGLS